MKKIRVMHIVQTLDVGGLERLIVDSTKFSDRQKFDFIVCCLSERGALAAELEKDGIEVIFLNKRYGFNLKIVFMIASIIRRMNIDLVHTHNQRPLIYGALAAKFAKTKACAHTRHGRNDPDNRKSLLMSRLFTAFTDKVVCVSQDIYDFSLKREKIPVRKLQLIRNGIDIEKFSRDSNKDDGFARELGVAEGEKLVGMVGRLSKIKNHRFALEIFKALLKKYEKIRLMIAGGGPLRNELSDYADSLGLKDKVIFLGERFDIARILCIFDIFILSSFSEGISLVLLEAMAAGLPIVATNVGGNPELIKHGENGFLVPVQDREAFCGAIAKLLCDKGLYEKISYANRRKALQEFDIRGMCRQYGQLYESLIVN